MFEDSIVKIIEKGELKKIKKTLNQIINLIHKWRKDALKMKHYDLLKLVLDDLQIFFGFKNKKDLENENRLENLKELLRAMQDYDNLQNFLEHVALATSIDQEWEGAKINLMTLCMPQKDLSLMLYSFQVSNRDYMSSFKIFRRKRRFYIRGKIDWLM